MIKKLFGKFKKTDTRGIMKIALAGWLILSVLGAFPYLFSGYCDSFASALLESVSGFTTTGVSVYAYPELLPKWLLVYRSLTSWIGGAAVLVFLASMLKSFDADEGTKKHDNSYQLYRNGIRFGRIATRLLITYIIMSVVSCALLFFSGQDSLSAFIYACASVSTGGFTNGTAATGNLTQSAQSIVLLFMILSCVNYTVYYHLIKKHFSKVGNSTELFAYIFLLAGASVVVILNLTHTGQMDIRTAVHDGIFQVVSGASTTGLNICDMSKWPTFSRLTVYLMSFAGGCTASIGSGIKILRLVMLAKIISRSFVTRIHPQAVVAVKINNNRVSESSLSAAFTYMVLYFMFFGVSIFVLSFECADFETPFVLACALLNNLGGQFVGNYSALMKIIMCIIMLAGRLELYAVLLPFSRADKRFR